MEMSGPLGAHVEQQYGAATNPEVVYIKNLDTGEYVRLEDHDSRGATHEASHASATTGSCHQDADGSQHKSDSSKAWIKGTKKGLTKWAKKTLVAIQEKVDEGKARVEERMEEYKKHKEDKKARTVDRDVYGDDLGEDASDAAASGSHYFDEAGSAASFEQAKALGPLSYGARPAGASQRSSIEDASSIVDCAPQPGLGPTKAPSRDSTGSRRSIWDQPASDAAASIQPVQPPWQPSQGSSEPPLTQFKPPAPLLIPHDSVGASSATSATTLPPLPAASRPELHATDTSGWVSALGTPGVLDAAENNTSLMDNAIDLPEDAAAFAAQHQPGSQAALAGAKGAKVKHAIDWAIRWGKSKAHKYKASQVGSAASDLDSSVGIRGAATSRSAQGISGLEFDVDTIYDDEDEDTELLLPKAQAPAGLGLPVRVQAAKGGALPNGARLLSSVILVQSVQAHEGVMWVMKASRDGSLLATGGQDGAVKIWRVLPAPPVAGATPKGALIRPADLSGEDPFHTQASTSGTDLYSLSCAGGSTGGAGLQGSSTGGEDQLQTQLTLGTKPAPPPSLFDDVAAASPARGYVGPVPAIRPQPLAVLRGHSEDVVDVAWSAGGFLLTASVDKTAKLWHIHMGSLGTSNRAAASTATTTTVRPGGAGSVWDTPPAAEAAGAAGGGAGGGGQARAPQQPGALPPQAQQQWPWGWGAATGGGNADVGGDPSQGGDHPEEPEEHMVCLAEFPHPDFVTSVAFHPTDCRRFATGCADGRLRVWSAGEGKVLASAAVMHDMITSVAWSPDGHRVVAGTLHGKCRHYEWVPTLKPGSKPLASTAPLKPAATVGGATFAAAAAPATSSATVPRLDYVAQVDVKDRRRGQGAPGRKVTAIVAVPNRPGDFLVTSNDSRIRRYERYTVACKYKGLRARTTLIRASCSPDGSLIVAGSEDGGVYVWESGLGEAGGGATGAGTGASGAAAGASSGTAGGGRGGAGVGVGAGAGAGGAKPVSKHGAKNGRFECFQADTGPVTCALLAAVPAWRPPGYTAALTAAAAASGAAAGSGAGQGGGVSSGQVQFSPSVTGTPKGKGQGGAAATTNVAAVGGAAVAAALGQPAVAPADSWKSGAAAGSGGFAQPLNQGGRGGGGAGPTATTSAAAAAAAAVHVVTPLSGALFMAGGFTGKLLVFECQ